MLTQAATCLSRSWSASFSAAARSGRLVKTSSVLISQSFVNRRIKQTAAEHALQPRVVESPRLLHERKQARGHPPGRKFSRDSGRPRHAVAIGNKVEPVAQLHLGVVGCVVGAGWGLVVQGAADDRRQVGG